MLEQSRSAEPADKSRVEYLLGVLRGLSQSDPSPALRERLELLSSRRVGKGTGLPNKPLDRTAPGLSRWLRLAFVAALFIAVGISVAFVIHIRRPQRLKMKIEPKIVSLSTSANNETPALPSVPPPEARLQKIHRLPTRLAQQATPQQMIVRLPYSNSAIATGTNATLRVSMSQAELMSLGFPIHATLHDRRVVAELTLGDDGLPRAISVPLPLEVIKEKK